MKIVRLATKVLLLHPNFATGIAQLDNFLTKRHLDVKHAQEIVGNVLDLIMINV